MVEFLLKGLYFGLGIGLLIGPLFFTMVQTGMEHGVKKGGLFALGTWLSDLVLLILSYSTLHSVMPKHIDDISPPIRISFAAGIILFGLVTMLRPYNTNADSSKNRLTQLVDNLALRGFIINTINPSAFFIWLGMSAMVSHEGESFFNWNATAFFSGIMVMIICLDLGKLRVGKYLGPKLSSPILGYVKLISGLLFVIAGIILLLRIY